ncbi:MAG: amidohydrolase [Enterocloster asparagiformis]|nr:amidohydrolase [Enterocloster asparagiformis]
MPDQMNPVIRTWYEDNKHDVADLALKVWANAESLHEEYYACEVTAEFMKKQGFSVETFHCLYPERRPNTVVATWGSGKPVIGFIGEYDGLPDHGQEAVPYRAPIEGKCGHGCGHNLMNASCASATAALKAAMEAEGLSGTIKYFACPAEEGGDGKMHMAKAGVFDGLDCCFSWHPQPGTNLRIKEVIMNTGISLKVEFFGKTAHASVAPQDGRSALDACELMNVGINYLREHIPSTSRVFYKYSAGGDNVLPEYAAYEYFVRAADLNAATDLYQRVRKCAVGAATMTETKYKITVPSISLAPIQIDDFNNLLANAMMKLPKLTYTEDEIKFARELYRNISGCEPASDEVAIPSGFEAPTGIHTHVPNTTDVGWVARKIPTARLQGLAMIGGTSMHSWACVACTGHSIGVKGAVWSGMAQAQGGYDVLKNPSVIEAWWEELRRQTKDETEPVVMEV